MSVTSYDGFTVARTNLKAILDTARAGRLVTVTRGPDVSAVVSAVRLRQFLAATVASRARVVFEDGACVVFIPGLAVAAEASTFEEAITETLEGLRDYAQDWDSHLADAPNHAENWGLVNLMRLSDDDQLRAWLLADQ
ncbi:prevent-host-death protein [Pengzhenrongella frigida]|uniref:Prevent-host-death protein n=1 Tax=Pengzhenrongella frigida TaxID=1259133 RepID=A0A4V1ZH54_9MICO|nr:prevent-host-death protein [Cellulomonas sp. HLT2-17]RYV50854.1 prevent-host-death protein [Cellulomonas sp. HLT2-17]